MAYNVYGRLDDFLADLNVQSPSAPDRARYLRRLIAASQWVEQHCHQKFSAVTDAREFEINLPGVLMIPSLISVSALAYDSAGTGTYTTALTAGVGEDYVLGPNNAAPYWQVLFGTAWGRVRITGIWGYSNDSEALGVTLQGGGLTTSGTALSASGAHGLSEGETLLIESEQVYVSAVPESNKATIERAVNGTTAATHAASVPIRRRIYPAPVVEAVYFQAARAARGLQTGGANAGGQQFSQPYGEWPMIRDALAPYVIPVVG